jgi:hypothetical protein
VKGGLRCEHDAFHDAHSERAFRTAPAHEPSRRSKAAEQERDDGESFQVSRPEIH